jgi:hypothetical protein
VNKNKPHREICVLKEIYLLMATRTTNQTVTFARPFLLKGVDRILAAGDYRVVTDQELIQELSFSAYRRIATAIFVPAASSRGSSVEMVNIDPHDLQEARDRDSKGPSTSIARQAGMVGNKD